MKVSNEGQEVILLLLMGLLCWDLVFGDNVMNTGHQMLYNAGISQKIERFENEWNR